MIAAMRTLYSSDKIENAITVCGFSIVSVLTHSLLRFKIDEAYIAGG